MAQNQQLSLADWHNRYKQQAGWSQDVRRYLFGKADLGPGDKILEVGSGTGAVLSALSDEIEGKCFGIDIDIPSLKFSSSKHPKIHHAAADGFYLPFPNDILEVTYCHYLLLWVKNPFGILSEMLRVTKPGGYVMALAEPDYKARIDHPQSLVKLGELQTQSLEDQGIDPSMGRKLVGLFRKAGLNEISTGILGAQWVLGPSQIIDEQEWMMIQSDLSGELSPEALESYRRADARAREKGERVLFIPTFYAAGTVR